jgi:hypothetical protein
VHIEQKTKEIAIINTLQENRGIKWQGVNQTIGFIGGLFTK